MDAFLVPDLENLLIEDVIVVRGSGAWKLSHDQSNVGSISSSQQTGKSGVSGIRVPVELSDF